jgi:3-hydroxybutyryl-CoA dehydrogenase
MSEVRTVGVLGCGLMGGGIAQVSATAGFETIVREFADEPLARGMAAVAKSLDGAVQRERITADERAAIGGRLHATTSLDDLAGCDIVIEAVTEDLGLKQEVWKAADAAVQPEAIFASNTSSLTIAAMAGSTGRADRFVGLHFFNPAPAMRLVEVVRTVTTSDETFERAMAFAKALGKEPIAAKDHSGFIVNLLLVPYLLDAIRAVERRVATVEDIDTGMRLGAGHPMGPLTLSDFIGLDTLLKIAEIMHAEHLETRYGPPPLLRRMVHAGMYGRKSGRGFYDYAESPPVVTELGI